MKIWIFLQIYAWSVLSFQENTGKPRGNKNHMCNHVFFWYHWNKLLITNWDTLIPFLLASFLCLKSKNILFIFFFLPAGPLLATKIANLRPCLPRLPLNPKMLEGRFLRKILRSYGWLPDFQQVWIKTNRNIKTT